MIPIIQIWLNGEDISGKFAGRVLRGAIHETDGEKTDELRLSISNHDGLLAKPKFGAVLQVRLGWDIASLVKAGEFKVQDVTKFGEAARFDIVAQAAALDNSLKTQKNRAWKAPKTFDDVFKQIAADNQLTAAIHSSVAQIPIDKVLAQHGESDMHFAMRIARGVGAIAKVAQGKLVIVPKGAAESASGQAVTALTVTPSDLTGEWSIGAPQRPKRGACKANIFDRSQGGRSHAEAGDSANGPDYIFPHIFGSATEAKNAVAARSAAFKRGEKHFQGVFRPGIVPPAAGGALKTEDFGDDDDTDWTIKDRTIDFGAGISIKFRAELKAVKPTAKISKGSASAGSSTSSSGGVQEAGAVTAGSNVG